jgi:hypothetical protein
MADIKKSKTSVADKTVDKVADKAPKSDRKKAPKKDDSELAGKLAAADISVIDNLISKNSHVKCATVLGMYVLEAIVNIQKNEVKNADSYNPFKSNEYALTLTAAKKTEKKEVKAEKKTVHLKKDLKKTTEPEVKQDVETASSTETSSESSDDKNLKKVVSFNVNAKNYLGFIMNTFVAEVYSLDEMKKVKDSDAFTDLIMKRVTGSSVISRHIVTTVNRLESLTYKYGNHGYSKQITPLIDANFKNDSVSQYVNTYLMKYLQILATFLANELWVLPKTMNGKAVERAMRMAEVGNREYMVEKNHIKDDECDFGLSHGVLAEAAKFDKILSPPSTASKTKKKAPKKTDTIKKVESNPEPKLEAKTESKVQKSSAKPKPTKPVKPESEDEEEVDVDEEEEDEEPRKAPRKIN